MQQNDQTLAQEAMWRQICDAEGLDPERRMAARLAILGSAQAQDCTLYRPDELDPEAEEEDLGDARVLFAGPFQAPADWDEPARAEFFGDADPALFFDAFVECLARPGSRGFFLAEIGDYVAATTESGEVVMYYIHDCYEDERGRRCVLIRDDEPLY